MADGTRPMPTGRLSRLAKLAGAGLRAGVGALLDRSPDDAAKKTAAALGSMRGLAAKVGQMTGYVDGLVPEGQRDAYANAMKPLLSSAPRSNPDEIRRLLEEELDAPVDRLFASFEVEPFASASIGQVHRATLFDGRQVAVKVQHPGIVQAMEADLANAGLLEHAASLMGGARFDMRMLIATVRERFREELDYLLEADRYRLFARLHGGDAVIHVPAVVGERSGRRVLTTEFVVGRSFDELCASGEDDRRRAAEALWRFVYKGINVGGVFNADPHPGNYLFEPDGRVAFLDFGCVQRIKGDHLANARILHRAAMTGDMSTFDPAVSRIIQSRPGRLDRMSNAYMRRTFSPVLESPYRITRDFAASLFEGMKEMAAVARTTPDDEFFTMQPESLFMNRLHFGFYSVLARLDVEVDYRAVERAWWAEAEGGFAA
jgi:predicted unusual protein kinase regulating ubiquinone biosynthesis (AarF/ABC1/UbiB family)